MFERFTRDAREIVIRAEAEARALGHESVEPEHLLLGVAAMPSDAARVLAEHGATQEALREAVRAEAATGLGRSPAGRRLDGEALASIGIDADEVRRRVEAAFGPGALERGRRGRRGRRKSFAPFSPVAKQSLELALREAMKLGDRHIGPEHVLLGLLSDDGAAAVLRRVGAPLDRVRAGLEPAASRRGRGA